MIRLRVFLPLLAAVVWLRVPPAWAADNASGHFKLGEQLFEPTDVYAASVADFMAPAKKLVMVLLADFPFDHAKLGKAADLHREAMDQALAHRKNIIELMVRPDGDSDLFAYFSAAMIDVDLHEQEPNEEVQWQSTLSPRVEGRYRTKAPGSYKGKSYTFDFKVAVDVARR
jgi:hypothetical protein